MSVNQQNSHAGREEASLNKELWSVCRQDDNGNRFVVQSHLQKDEANRLVAELESHGHKQMYWMECEEQ